MLEVNDVWARYGRIPALNGVTLSVREGEAIGIIGHNGMGKTTLLRTLMGYLPLVRGNIQFDGRSIGAEPTYRRARLGLAYVPQGREIFPYLTVAENLRMAGTVNLDEILADFPALAPLLDHPGGALSGGQQQILAIGPAHHFQDALDGALAAVEGIKQGLRVRLHATRRRLFWEAPRL